MAVTRLLVVSGEVLDENDKGKVRLDISAGLSTLPTDIIQSLLPNLSSLPAQSVATPLDDGILLERVSPYLTLRFACRPSGTELASLLANLLAPATNPSDALNAVLVYSGLLAHGTGHWILPDFVLTPTSFVHQLEQINLSQPNATDLNGQQSFGRVHLHVAIGGFPSGGEWRHLLSRRPDLLGARAIQLAVNTNRAQVNQELNGATSDSSNFSALDDILQSMWMELPAVYCAPLRNPLVVRASTEPSLRALRLSLYIFPEGSGQSSILTLPGYSMLINAGHSHRPNCWPVLSYLDRLDSVFVTHWGVDNVLGMNAVLPCAFAPISSNGDTGDNAMCLLAPPPFPLRIAASPDAAATATSLSLNIPRLVSQLLSSFKQTGVALNLHTLSRGAKVASPPQPLRLYQKVGQGTLEAHVLTPADDDTTELRHATNSWMEALPSLTSTSVGLGKSAPASKVTIPLLSYISVSAIIVWRPARETEPILRILLVAPNAHQTRVLVSLEAIVAANIYLRHQRVSMADFDRKHSTSQTSTRTNGSLLTTKTSSGSFTKATPGRASTLPQPTQNISHQLKPIENKSIHDEEKSTMGLSANLKSGSDVHILGDDNQTKHSATAHRDQGDQSLRYTPDQPIDSAGQASVLLDDCHTPPPDEVVDSWGVPQFLPPPVPSTGTQTTTTKRPIAGPRKAPTTARSAHRSDDVQHPSGVAFASGCTEASGYAVTSMGTMLPPYDKIKPLYVDVSFLPGGGNPHLVDVEWFKRVRARFYVVTDPRPSVRLLDAMVYGKEAWTGPDSKLAVSVIFTCESDELMTWLGRNTARLNACHMDVAAIASRSRIQLVKEPLPTIEQPISTQALSCVGYRIDI